MRIQKVFGEKMTMKMIEQIDEPIIAININQTYRAGISAGELYDCTRGIWRLSRERAKNAQFAFAVFQRKVVEVYQIQSWHPEGTTEYVNRVKPSTPAKTRFEFVGKIAADSVRDKYLRKQMPTGHAQNPILYFNC